MEIMEADGLASYVAEQITLGVPAQAVKEALMEAGWLAVDADNAIRDAAAHATPVAVLSAHEDMIRMRHAVNSLDERVGRLEANLTGAPVAMPAAGTLESGVIGPERELPSPHRNRLVRWGMVLVLLVAFAAAGYWGMSFISTGAFTPLTRIYGEAALGIVLTLIGFFAGRRHHHGAANVLTGIGLALGALAAVGAWYLHWLEWSVALAIGALLVTLALVLGRFYDRWAR